MTGPAPTDSTPVDLTVHRVQQLAQARLRAMSDARIKAASICLVAEGHALPWPKSIEAISHLLIAAEQHAMVASALVDWTLRPHLARCCAAVAACEIGSSTAADANTVMWRAHLDEGLSPPLTTAMMDALRDLGYSVHPSWPVGRRVDDNSGGVAKR